MTTQQSRDSNYWEGFNKQVKASMLKTDVTQADLAEKMSISTSYLSDLLNGRRRWNQQTLYRLRQALGINLDSASAPIPSKVV
jgi:transcriptional regulator with XRE-family HTH domain